MRAIHCVLHRMRRAVLIVILAGVPHSAWCVNDPDKFAGDVAQIAIPAAALAITFYKDDQPGRWQFIKSFGTTVITTEVLKRAVNHTAWGERPNGGQYSFPSGHTASACGGGFFLQRRYGWAWGAPALALAAYTGYTRVDEDEHHIRDVVAACALAWGSARYFVTKQIPGQFSVQPMIGAHRFALNIDWRF